MRKFFCLLITVVALCTFGCAQQLAAIDPYQIPTEIDYGKVEDIIKPANKSDAKSDNKPAAKSNDASGSKSDSDNNSGTDNDTKTAEPLPEPQAGVDYILAADDLTNLQLTDPTKPVYDKHNLWERQANGLPIVLPELEPYEEESTVYLTFDDGPDSEITPQILDILKAEGVKATFYVCGNMVDANPAVLKRIFSEGHAIGNHSYNHRYDELYNAPWSFMEQIIQTDNSIRNVIGVRPFIIRAPGGASTMFSANYYTMVTDCGYIEHDWNAVTGDATSSEPNASEQINNVLRSLGDDPPRSVIILMHCEAGKTETVKALPDIIHFLRDWGYKFGVVTPMTPQPW